MGLLSMHILADLVNDRKLGLGEGTLIDLAKQTGSAGIGRLA